MKESSSPAPLRSVLIVGLGLIGGSFAKRLSARGLTVHAVDPNVGALTRALREGVAARTGAKITPELAAVDCVLVCTPIGALAETFAALAPLLPARASAFDCASVNALPCALAEEAGLRSFASLHPMAGSEQGGYDAARAHLFENAYVVFTPCELTDRRTAQRAEAITALAGGLPLTLDAATHDRYAAVISHLPHAVSAALVNLMAASCEDETLASLAAGGFRDITRISSSSPALWSEICLANRRELSPLVECMQAELARFQVSLASNNRESLREFFGAAKTRRDSIESRPYGLLGRTFDLSVDIADVVGILAKITRLLGDADINICNIGIVNSRENEGGVLKIALPSAESRDAAKLLLADAGYEAAAVQ